MDPTLPSPPRRTGLILTGGGARAAYQVGVLRAIVALLPRGTGNPFPVICGTSAGAINAVGLAAGAVDFRAAVARMSNIWRRLRPDEVYRAGPVQMARTLLRWAGGLLWSRWREAGAVSLLDSAPLAELLRRSVDFDGIARSIEAGALDAVCVTVSAYASEQSLSFFDGHEGCLGWYRTRRRGMRCRLGVDHVMASSAIPFIFPPVKLPQGYCADGSMQQLAPFSPALHLGADRVLAISVGRTRATAQRGDAADAAPSLAQIGGFLLNCVFLDSLEMDLERLERINNTLGLLPESVWDSTGVPLRPVETLVLSPSRPLEPIAAHHADRLPPSMRFLLRCLGANRRGGASLLSYLLFERRYCRALIRMGYEDTLARKDEVLAFLGPTVAGVGGTVAGVMTGTS